MKNNTIIMLLLLIAALLSLMVLVSCSGASDDTVPNDQNTPDIGDTDKSEDDGQSTDDSPDDGVQAEDQIPTITVSFIASEGKFGDGTARIEISIQAGEFAAAPELPVRPGYSFAGWLYNGKITDPESAKLLADSTFVASWERQLFRIDLYDGYENTFIEAEFEERVSLPLPKRETYLFKGWSTNPDSFSSIESEFIYNYTEGMKLYAFWEPVFSHESIALEDGSLGIVITGYRGTEIDVVIPENLYTGTVIGIETGAFSGLSAIRSISVPPSVERLAGGAFYGLTSLEELSLPLSFERLSVLFSDRRDGSSYPSDVPPSLKRVRIMTAEEKVIPEKCFMQLSGIESFELEGNITAIEQYAFYGCSAITDMDLSGLIELRSLGDNAFAFCKRLESITIPACVERIGELLLYSSDGLERISLPFLGSYPADAERGFLSYLFGGKSSIDNREKVPKALRRVELTAAESIYANGFLGCEFITQVILPEDLTYIGSAAFMDCASLMQIIIPSSVSYVGVDAFFGCASLTVLCRAPVQPQGWEQSWNSGGCPVKWGYQK
jgi:hypothetical protein